MVDCSKPRVLTGVIVCLVVALLAVIVAFVYRETRNTNDTSLTAENVNSFYNGYFRTPSQQETFRVRYLNNYQADRKIVNKTVNTEGPTCQFTCGGNPARRKRQANTGVEHGCCISYVVFDDPDTHTNLVGNLRTFLQFDSTKQYFAVHNCSVINGCTGCTCSQESSLYVAVVLKSGVTEADDLDDTELDYFYFDGCCKCLT